jgi:sortase A
MRLVVTQESLRRILRWTQRILLAGAASMLAYCGFVLMDAWIFQNGERRQLDRLLTGRQEANSGARQAAAHASPKNSLLAPTDGLIGRIEIPRLGLSAIVIEGTSATTLRRAVGHIRGTALPGQPGNIGISGHRDTFFRPLRNIQQNDIITFTTLLGKYRYRVVSTKVVGPYDIAVLDPSGNEVLTLVTCYPFYFVGSAPDRFIVRANRVI